MSDDRIAVVMPERKQWDASAGTAENMKSAAWNSALDEVSRLNRRAIPMELLNELLRHIDKVTYMPFGEPMTPDDGERKKLSDELRALLGKS